jgi:hypothetical protein
LKTLASRGRPGTNDGRAGTFVPGAGHESPHVGGELAPARAVQRVT